jgi:hypothetical protein
VLNWQLFLRGQELYLAKVDANFGPRTEAATKAFQLQHDRRVTGRVDDPTLTAALLLGYSVVEDRSSATLGPNWPVPPDDWELQPLTQEGRGALFGKFSFEVEPDLEMIAVDPTWVHENIVSVQIPAPSVRSVQFHKRGAEKLVELFEAWKRDGLLDYVLTWDGSYAPRFVRGSRTVLSAHAWGTAFDINAKWNALGVTPALVGERGCVRELTARANALGWFWGGHYGNRKDGMHFELVKL